MCDKKERDMIKKHVALSLALFTAGAIYLGSTIDAEAATTTKHKHTKCVAKNNKTVCQSFYHTHTQKTVASLFTKKPARTATTSKTATKSTKTVAKSTRTKVAAAKHPAKKQVAYHKTARKQNTSANAMIAPAVASGRDSHTINVADDYIGLSERGSKRQLMNLFGFAFKGKIDPARTPWCAAFANGILSKTGKRGTGSLTATSFMGWGRKTQYPSQGDIVVLKPGKRYHVGFYMGTVKRNGKTYIAVLGGNQSNSVKVTYYRASKVVAYRTAG